MKITGIEVEGSPYIVVDVRGFRELIGDDNYRLDLPGHTCVSFLGSSEIARRLIEAGFFLKEMRACCLRVGFSKVLKELV